MNEDDNVLPSNMALVKMEIHVHQITAHEGREWNAERLGDEQ